MRSRTSFSVARTLSPRATAARATVSICPVSSSPSSARVPHAQPPLLDQRAHAGRQAQEAHRVGHRRAILADPRRHLLLRQPELVDQPVIGRRLLDRVEVGALQILDQRALERLAGVDVLHHHRDLHHPGALRRPPPPLAGDEQVAAAVPRPHHQRHDHAVRLDRRRQLVELGLAEVPPRLLRARVDVLDRRLEVGPLALDRRRGGRGRARSGGRRRGRRARRHQRAQPAPEPALLRVLAVSHRPSTLSGRAGRCRG
jgi:hypothetical protein